MELQELAGIIEALLFASDKPLSVQRFHQLISQAEPKQIEEAVNHLILHYEDHAFEIVKVGGGYQMMSKPDYHDLIKRLYEARKRPRLSQAALETVAVVAYRQPVSRIEIEAIRGVNSDGVLGTLLERNLIEIRGRADTVGRPLLYGTTEEFLHYFGLNEVTELPRPEEIEALLSGKEEEQQSDVSDNVDKHDET